MTSRLAVFLLPLALLGCEESLPSVPTTIPLLTPLGEDFDTDQVGSLRGEVTWTGPIPQIPPFRSTPLPLTDQVPPPARDWANPNAPLIHPRTRGVGSAIVFLRAVDPRRSRPWDHEPVRIELRDQTFHLLQDGPRRIGFVRAGCSIEIASCDPVYHLAQFRGSTFFSRPLPRQGSSGFVALNQPGLVEVRSGCAYYWMRTYLHVSQHPYLAHLDELGRFRLEDIPSGDYEVVAWHPNWQVLHREYNPDNFRPQQVVFAPPLESVQRVRILAGQTASISLSLGSPARP